VTLLIVFDLTRARPVAVVELAVAHAFGIVRGRLQGLTLQRHFMGFGIPAQGAIKQ